MKTFTAFAAALILVALPLATVDAARFERGEIITIPEQEFVPQNLYMAGGQVTFSSTAQKDLVMAGGKILQNGVVWGDVLAAGGTVDIVDDVRGDVRVAGGQVTIQGLVSGDLVVAGGAVTILPGTTIAGDLVAAGGAVLMQGTVSGQTKIYAGEAQINGTLAGPVFITVQEKVSFGEKAVIGSTLNYRAPEEAEVAEGAKLGEQVTYTALDIPRIDEGTLAAILAGVVTLIFLAKLLAVAVSSALVASFFTDFSRSVARESIGNFWKAVVLGVAGLIVTPVVAVVLIATIVGMYFGFILLALYALTLLLASVFVAIVTGAVVSKLALKDIRIDWKWAILGSVLVFVVWLVPILGWLVVCVLYLMTVGSLTIHVWNAVKARMS